MSDLDSLSIDELKEQADLLGITYANNIKEATLRNKIRAQLGEPVEEVELSHPSVKKDDERITIIINEDERDKQPVQVGINGRLYVMKRGKPVSVPPGVIEVLDHAVKTVWNEEMESYHQVKRYPYQIAASQ